MATKVFPRSNVSGIEYLWSSGNNDAKFNGSNSAWQYEELATAQGSSDSAFGTNTVAGPTSGVECANGGTPLRFVSPPLEADVTISGTITFNIWALESNMSANVAINCAVYKIDGATGAITQIIKTARTTELGTTNAAANFTGTPTSTDCKKGDRIMVVLFGDDAGTMNSGFTFNISINGAAGVAGDTFVSFTETFTFETTTPAGSQIFPTDTASDVATASVDREAWTSRGAGVQTDLLTLGNGWLSPTQWTDTAGGTVVDWFTKQLEAFTLGGAVLCNIRAAMNAGANEVTVGVEIAVVDDDGTNPVVWAIGTHPTELTTSEAAKQFWVSGDDLAVTDGQRIRIRIFADDPAIAPAGGAGTNQTLYYAGTTGGSSGDTYFTFEQTLTEFTGAGEVSPAALAIDIANPAPARIDQVVSPGVIALTRDQPAPSVTANVNPGAIALTRTQVAPTQIDQVLTPAALARAFAAVAPRVDQAVSPAAVGLTLTPVAPVRFDRAVHPAALALALATIGPRLDQRVDPAALARALAAVAPEVQQGVTTVNPGPIALAAGVIAFSQIDQVVTPGALARALVAVEPAVTQPGAGQQVEPEPIALNVIGVAPGFDQPGGAQQVTMDVIELAVAVVNTAGMDQVVAPAAHARTLTGQAPSVELAVTPPALNRSLAVVAFTRLDQTVDPAAAARILTPQEPRLDLRVTPAALARAVAMPSPAMEFNVNPPALNRTLVPVAFSRIDQRVTPTELALLLLAIAPNIGALFPADFVATFIKVAIAAAAIVKDSEPVAGVVHSPAPTAEVDLA